jgi:NAD(P)-dependent dehydrogenase (short-subunit alcohol dehydrogenase family)
MADPFDLTGMIAVVTGAAGGIGRAAAAGLARLGADLVLVDRPGVELAAVGEAVRAAGRQALAVAADVAVRADVERLFARAVERFGTVDILVNNAGVADHTPALELDDATWTRVLEVNLKGPLLCSQAAGRLMVPRRRGKIINIASQLGLVGRVNGAAYCASKGGLIQLTRALAVEWGPYNIQVNAVAPGPVRTPMTAPRLADERARAQLTAATALRRLGEPEDLVGTIQLLAAPASDYITGAVLVVDGGYTAQ